MADPNSTFATAVNCMDGRVQESVTAFTRREFGVDYVDMVTEAGVVASISEGVRRHVDISVQAHDSKGVVVAAHPGCAGNPISDEEQKVQCVQAAALIASEHPGLSVIPVWARLDGAVEVLLTP